MIKNKIKKDIIRSLVTYRPPYILEHRFTDLVNKRYKSFQNNPDDFNDKWFRRIDFINIWDRHSCKVYSSIAEQSNKYYLGNSQMNFNPIKCFKLNSTDQRF